VESFNGKFRDECLSLEWFRSRAEAKVIIEAWRRHYNAVRPHSSLDYLTPNEFVERLARPALGSATGRSAAVSGAFRLRSDTCSSEVTCFRFFGLDLLPVFWTEDCWKIPV